MKSFIEVGKYIGLLDTDYLMGNSTSRQMEWVWVSPPPSLCPAIANLFVEDTEDSSLSQAAHKPLSWFRYVDDTFVIWPLETEKLPPEWPAQQYTIHRGYRDRRPPQFSWHWHIQETRWLPGQSRLPKTYPHKTLPEATSVFLALTYTGDPMAPWAITSSKNLPTQNPT